MSTTPNPGTARVLRAVPDDPAQSPVDSAPDGWEPPVPLSGAHRDLPAFPVDVLPDWVAEHVAAVTEFTQTPPDLPGCVALAALSTAAGGRATVRIRPGWFQPVNIFTVVALPPGSRKSDVFEAMTRPLVTAEAELIERARPRIEEASLARKVAEREAEKSERAASSADPTSIAMAADAMLTARAIELLAEPQLIADDITPEKAATVMAEQGGRLAVLAPEGGIIATLAGRYSGTPNFEVFLRGHSGETMRVDRQGRDSQRIDRATLTLGLVVQPQVIRDLGKIGGARDKGLLGRFLYSLPVNTVGHRAIRVPEVPEPIATAYDTRLRAMVLTLADWTDPALLMFAPDADEAMFELQAEIEPKLGPRGAWHHIADWAGKYAGATARLAGLIHLAEHPTDAWHHEITADTFARGRALGTYYLAHALAAFDHMGKDDAHDGARALLGWIASERLTHFTRRDAHRANRGRFATAADIDPALEVLEEHGHIRQAATAERHGAGRKPSPTYFTHPIHRVSDPGHNGQNGQNS